MGVSQSTLFHRDLDVLTQGMSAGFPESKLPMGALDRMLSRVSYMILCRIFQYDINWVDDAVVIGLQNPTSLSRQTAWKWAQLLRTRRILPSLLYGKLDILNGRLIAVAGHAHVHMRRQSASTTFAEITRMIAIRVTDDFFVDLHASIGTDLTRGLADEVGTEPGGMLPGEAVHEDSSDHVRCCVMPLLLRHMYTQSIVIAMRRYADAMAAALVRMHNRMLLIQSSEDGDDESMIHVNRSQSVIAGALYQVVIDDGDASIQLEADIEIVGFPVKGASVVDIRTQMLRVVMRSPTVMERHTSRDPSLSSAALDETCDMLMWSLIQQTISPRLVEIKRLFESSPVDESEDK